MDVDADFPSRAKVQIFWRGEKVGLRKNGKMVDFADSITLGWHEMGRVVEIRVRDTHTASAKWDNWSETNISKVEQHIREDLACDGLSVEFIRLAGPDLPCTAYMCWTALVEFPKTA